MKLDRLLDQADAAGENTSRKELVAALICAARLSDAQLGKALRNYRKARVRQLLPVPDGQNVVPFKKRKPGPRTVASP